MHEISQSFSLAPSQAMQVVAAKLNATNNNDGPGTHHEFNYNTPFIQKKYISHFQEFKHF